VPSAGAGEPPELRWFLVPRRDYTIADDWFTLGMRGSGSKSIVVDEAFVPAHRTVIARELFDEMVAHAREDAPNECCGMVATRDGQAVRVYRAINAAASPLRYEIDGAEQYRIQMEIDDEGLDLGAIYHSHTRTEPYPSQTDINLAFYPDALYVIVGLASAEPEVKAYEIRDGRVADAELSMTG